MSGQHHTEVWYGRQALAPLGLNLDGAGWRRCFAATSCESVPGYEPRRRVLRGSRRRCRRLSGAGAQRSYRRGDDVGLGAALSKKDYSLAAELESGNATRSTAPITRGGSAVIRASG